MNIFINGKTFNLTERGPRPSATKPAVVIDGRRYDVDDKKRLQSVFASSHKIAVLWIDNIAVRWIDSSRAAPHQVTILGQVWSINAEGTYSRTIRITGSEQQTINAEDKNMKILIGDDYYMLTPQAASNPTWAPLSVDGVAYAIDDLEKLESLHQGYRETLNISWSAGTILVATILDQVWSLNAAGTYSRKVDKSPTPGPFLHAGQTVSLDGVEVEVLRLDRGIVFWYDAQAEIHGICDSSKLKSTLAETMRADLARGLQPKELIALGWSRKC